MDPSSLQCHALRAHGHAEAVVDAVQATAAEDAAEKQTNARSTPPPTLTEVAVQAVPKVWNSLFTNTLVHKLTNRNLMWFKQLTVETNRKRESKFRCVGKYHLP